MPSLSEDDMIGELFLPETTNMLIMDDIDRPDWTISERRRLAESIRQESTLYGNAEFVVSHSEWLAAVWEPGENSLYIIICRVSRLN
jgi:hypothetical protein